MLDSWNSSIFSNIKNRLQDSAMKLVHAERNGEAFDSQLVIGVRESYGNNYFLRKHFTCVTIHHFI
jgi:cullin-5